MILQITEKADNFVLINSPVSLEWSPVQAGVRIDMVSGLAASKTYNMRVLIV